MPGKRQEAYVNFLYRRFAQYHRRSAFPGKTQNVYQLLTFQFIRGQHEHSEYFLMLMNVHIEGGLKYSFSDRLFLSYLFLTISSAGNGKIPFLNRG